jgi:Ca2+-binding RTX toxin-like protein
MRRIVLVGAVAALMVAVFASAALARTFTCTDRPCFGTDDRDKINERPAFGTADKIYGLRGADLINAAISPGDRDIVFGGRGNDTLRTDDGFPEFVDDRDEVDGGRGTDTCYINAGDRHQSCEVLFIDGERQR